MYRFNCLDNAFAAIAYQPFTFPLYRSRLQGLKLAPSTVAIAATDAANQPIGLALAEIRPDGRSAEVLSIFVQPTHRQQGVGTALLARLAAELSLRGCDHAYLVYTTGQPTTPALERLLQKNNWTSPQPRMLVCRSTTKFIANAPWMQRKMLPAAYQIFPWQDITTAECLAIQQTQAASPWIPKDLYPLQPEPNLELLNSLGLRYQGQVVGWMITHRLAPDTIRYSYGFIRQDLQKMGRLISLIANAVQLQIDAETIPNGIWVVSCDRAPMIQFVRKHMAPYLTAIEETRGCFKSLIKDANQPTVSVQIAGIY
jgi:GNAT superfamily N-acetyltransferase